jgi:hypothetical protein
MDIFKKKLLKNKGKAVRIKTYCNPSDWEAKTG